MARRLTRHTLWFWAALGMGCSWQRFDDVSENPPVVSLKKPGGLNAGFGHGLATASQGESVQLLSIGASPSSSGAVFELGVGESPGLDAIDTGHCESEGDYLCASLSTPVGLERAGGPGEVLDLCFITGVGASKNGRGLMLRCNDSTQVEWPVPEIVDDEVIDPILDGERLIDPLRLAADRAVAPAVLAGAPELMLAFYYAPLSQEPVELRPAVDDEPSYGSSVAVLEVGHDRLFAVGAPEQGHVWLYRMVDDGDGTHTESIGCLGGIAGFGRTLSGGWVDDDAIDDLVVADAQNVSVFSGAVLAALPATDAKACSLGSLPEGGLLGSFSCGSTEGVEGCSGSDFGAALAVGDLDGDGDGEVIVGAPQMTVRGEVRAGAAIVYDVEGDEPHAFSEVMFVSSLESDDKFGSSLATPRLANRDVVAAGAPGGGRTFVMYCPEMLTDSLRNASSRCR